jgi:uncharacterized protein (DUF2141 family)
LLYGSTLTAAGATDLTVTVSGVQNDRGYIISTVFNSETSFLKPPEAFASLRIKASQADVGYSLRNLPPGKYAVSAFHDVNGNGKLDTDPSGQPTEVYGFSNDARGSRSLRTRRSRLGTKPKPFPSGSAIDRTNGPA